MRKSKKRLVERDTPTRRLSVVVLKPRPALRDAPIEQPESDEDVAGAGQATGLALAFLCLVLGPKATHDLRALPVAGVPTLIGTHDEGDPRSPETLSALGAYPFSTRSFEPLNTILRIEDRSEGLVRDRVVAVPG